MSYRCLSTLLRPAFLRPILASSCPPAFAISSTGTSRSPCLFGGASQHFSSTSPALSHVGSKPVPIPQGVSLYLDSTAVNAPRTPTLRDCTGLIVKGPLGTLRIDLMPYILLTLPGPQPYNSAEEGGLEPVAKLAKEIAAAAVQANAGPLSLPLPAGQIPICSKPGSLGVTVLDSTIKKQRQMWGLTRVLIANAVKGVSEGYTTSLQMVGVGYRAELEELATPAEETRKRQRLNLRLGYSHPVIMDVPTTPSFLGVKLLAPTSIELRGLDKQELGDFAAQIRRWRKPEPYNGKGIFVNGETIRRKEVKKK